MNCELSASSELFHRAGSCHQSCGQHAHAGSHTSLSLGFCSNRDDVVLQLWAPYLRIRQAGGGRRAEPLQTAKPAQQLRPLTGSAEAISGCVGVKPGSCGSRPSRENQNHALLGLRGLGSAVQSPTSVTPGETLPRWRRESHQDGWPLQMTDLRSLAGLQAGLGEYFFERLTVKHS